MLVLNIGASLGQENVSGIITIYGVILLGPIPSARFENLGDVNNDQFHSPTLLLYSTYEIIPK